MNERNQVPQQVQSLQVQPSQPRAPYAPPRIERIGGWQAMTLQLSVPPPVFPILGHALFEKTGEQ